MIADLHCHYPMHLVASEPDPEGPDEGWLRRLLDRFEGVILDAAAAIVNDSGWATGWRVKSVDDLEAGGAEIVCSVLYWPASEFDFVHLNEAPPLEIYFDYLKRQLEAIEQELPGATANRTPLTVVRSAGDVDNEGMRFVHCIEGGFHLGQEPARLDERVAWLAERGVLYITVAHIFYREVATEAPAVPSLTDQRFLEDFPEPAEVTLTERGEALIEAMYRHKVLIDISHMSERAVRRTFELVEKLDAENPDRDPRKFPIIATHVGMQAAGPQARAQEYNLSEGIARKVADRGGVIGLIAAQHQLGDTNSEAESEAVIRAHLRAMGEAIGNEDGDASAVAALGSDIDGFIKPTLKGFENAKNFGELENWVRAAGQRDPEAILHGNAERVIKARFE
jgi:microsomal dipeptidase-like Zn-dependent dipeptidase